MHKKEYRAIAKIIKENIREHGDRIAVIDNFCDYLKEDNPLFDEVKFREACGDN